VSDWPVGCYSSPGSHQCDSSVPILRGGGDHESLARGPWLHQFTWLSWKLDPVSCELFKGPGLCFGYHVLPKEDNLHPEIESMPGPMRPGSRDFSKDNISQLRVERKEITFSDASLEMAVLILVRPKGPPANRRYSTAFPSAISSPLFRHLSKHFNPHERNGDRG
jgi:hypothetical protein